MEFNFTGSSRPQRKINLGRQHGPKSVEAIAAEARAQREDRRVQKLRMTAAKSIQVAYRKHVALTATRHECAQEFEYVWLNGTRDTSTWVYLTRLMVVSQGKQVHSVDAHRLAIWANEMCITREWPKEPAIKWSALLGMVVKRMLATLRCASQLPVSDTSVLVTFLVWLLSDASECDQAHMAAVMVRSGLLRAMREYLLMLPKEATAEQAACVSLILQPLTLFPEPTTEFVENVNDASNYPIRSIYIRSFVSDILTIPLLLHRMPIPSVTAFSAQFPMHDLMCHVQTLGAYYDVTTNDSVLVDNPIHSPYLLANVLVLTSKRIAAMQNGQDVSAYLLMLATLENALPKSIFADVQTDVDERTKKQLAMIVSNSHIRAVLASSMRFAHSTRPALCNFLVATLYAWPTSVKDTLLIAMLHGYDKTGHSRSAHIGSLARELWRGWVRSSSLVRRISGREQGFATNASNVLDALTNVTFAQDWPLFLTMCIEYERCLLILGDDEFYPPKTINATKPTKNPFSLDELVTLSGLLRNITFAMYWNKADMPDEKAHVSGTRVRIEQVRELCTNLFQQLHTRDSRRRFVPDTHWHMLGQHDLPSFIQAVVLEEKELAMALSHDEDAPSRAHASILSQRARAFMTPRLEVLNNISFVIPFDVRVEIFRQFVRNDIDRLGISRDIFAPTRRHRATIRRGHVAEDGMAQLNRLGPNLKEPLEIVFIDQWGIPEAGIDGSGLFKEFLVSIIREVFDTDRGLWCANELQELYPNPHSYAHGDEQLVWYMFLGRILGKALYEGILVDVKFADFFLSKWLGQHGYIDDLASLESLDSELYRGLIALKNYTGDVESDFALNFTVTDDEFGVRTNKELIPGGTNISVTRENRLSYIYLITKYRLSTQIEDQCSAFFYGLSEMIDPRWLRLFNREELRVLVSGADTPIDVADLRRNTVYGGYHEKDMAIEYFWESLTQLDQASLKAFLRFVTSSPNPPLLGFSELNPKFAIRHAGDDVSRLPTASTCVNLLKLPAYTSASQCLEKLKYAIYAGAGFDLS